MKKSPLGILALVAGLALTGFAGAAEARGNGGNDGYNGSSGYGRHDDNNYRRGGGRDRLPPGDWAYSCQNASVRGGVLYAQCQTVRGRLRNASLDIRGCRDVENSNGRLVCTRY